MTSGLRFASFLVESLLPADCGLCGAPLPAIARGGVCAACWRGIVQLPSAACPRCADRSANAELCESCLGQTPPWSRAVAAAPYEGTAREILHRFKFEDWPELAAPLAGRMTLAALAAAGFVEGTPMLVPVPQRLSRRLRRGYNPAGLLARHAARALGLECLRRGLVKARATRDQATLADAALRRTNVTGAFRASRRGAAKVCGRAVILVDDVLTTGATAADCARALRDAGARDVRVLAFARTLRRR